MISDILDPPILDSGSWGLDFGSWSFDFGFCILEYWGLDFGILILEFVFFFWGRPVVNQQFIVEGLQ